MQVQVQVHIVDSQVHMKTLKLNCPTVRAVLVRGKYVECHRVKDSRHPTK